MRSRTCVMAIFAWVGLAVIGCGPVREQRPEARETVPESAYGRLSQIDHYQVGTATYEHFRSSEWPSFTILHMDVRSGPVEQADAVVVLGVAGGDATSAGTAAETQVEAVLEQSDARGVCIVRGWLEGERHVAALPTECPAQIRDELDDILYDFDNLTGGDAIWALRFEQGLLRSKQGL
jgi:hypothetical protein